MLNTSTSASLLWWKIRTLSSRKPWLLVWSMLDAKAHGFWRHLQHSGMSLPCFCGECVILSRKFAFPSSRCTKSGLGHSKDPNDLARSGCQVRAEVGHVHTIGAHKPSPSSGRLNHTNLQVLSQHQCTPSSGHSSARICSLSLYRGILACKSDFPFFGCLSIYCGIL